MKKNILFILPTLAICLLLFHSCGKEKPTVTVVKGLVIDKYTEKPIDNVSILFLITHKPQTDGSSNTEHSDINSDVYGNFYFENDLPIRIFDARKTGYVSKGGGTQVATIRQGEVNDITIKMIPKDGYLKILFENFSNQSDSVYVAVYSPSQYSEATISKGVVLREGVHIQSMSSSTNTISLASEELIDVYWGFSPLPYDITTSPFHDSVFISRHDTTLFAITF